MTKRLNIYTILLAGTFLGSPAVAETTLPGGEYGEGVQSIYYKWEGTDNHKQLITTTDKNEADITVKYGKRQIRRNIQGSQQRSNRRSDISEFKPNSRRSRCVQLLGAQPKL